MNVARPWTTIDAMNDPRLKKLAEVLVNYSVQVRPGDLVRLSAPMDAEPLVIELYGAILRAGGHPSVRLSSERLQEILLKHGSDAQLKFVDPMALFEVEKIDCSIGVWAERNTRALSNVDPGRIGLAEAARRPVLKMFLARAAEKKLRWCGTQFPTEASAQDAEMSLAEYEDFVFTAGQLDKADPVGEWKRMSERQARLVELLAGKSDYRVVAGNGTDVRMSLAGRTWINCDGHENFPDGEVFTGPVIESVNGRISFSFPAVYNGREVTDVVLTFRDGKVVDAQASKGLDFLISMLDTDGGSRSLGECAIGTNFGITRFTRNTLFDEKIGGTVHFALGAGYPETGNSNDSGLHWDMVVDLRRGGFIEIDGEKINIDGRFTREQLPAPDANA